jgi:hypothetical protein
MSRLEELPPDQRAALSLLLRQRKSYAEVGRLLQIPPGAVHDRAQAALAVLAPGEARALTPERREEVGDYLLGQAGIADRLKTRTYLTEAESARNWARAVASELEQLTPGELPEIPAPSDNDLPYAAHPAEAAEAAGGAPPAPPPPAPPADGEGEGAHHRGPLPASPSSSLLGGALVVVAVVVAVVVGVLLLTNGSGKHKSSSTSSTASKTTANAKGPAVHQLALRSPFKKSRSVGVVEVLSEGGKRAFYIEADHIPASKHFFYAVWLYNSPGSAEPLSKAPPVGNTHRLAGGALLPADAGNFKRILLTRETDTHPKKPGKVVLEGPFSQQ